MVARICIGHHLICGFRCCPPVPSSVSSRLIFIVGTAGGIANGIRIDYRI